MPSLQIGRAAATDGVVLLTTLVMSVELDVEAEVVAGVANFGPLDEAEAPDEELLTSQAVGSGRVKLEKHARATFW